jgi:hypothetical protein
MSPVGHESHDYVSPIEASLLGSLAGRGVAPIRESGDTMSKALIASIALSGGWVIFAFADQPPDAAVALSCA